MKKWFWLLAVMMLSLSIYSVSLAVSLTDIKGTKYEDAVENLVEVGLVNGYQDNTYRPDVPVTRAQMAKLMVIALGKEKLEESAKLKDTSFTDVSSSHWAYGYINVAKDIGIINGYTDGSFDPDATVSYAEATTMAVRALDYEDRVNQIKESWPTNYITVAKELKLFNNISSFNNGSGAARGDVAILLWNMLNTGVCKVVASNDKGLVYGQGVKMLEKYRDYVSISDGVITSVNFDDDFENATVKVEDSKNSVSISMKDEDVLKYVGKSISLLYDLGKKKIVSISAEKKYKEITGSVSKVTSSKIYLDDDEYALPSKDSIFLYRVDSLSEALEAKIFMDGKTVKYVLGQGALDVEAALVVNNNKTVNRNSAIEIKKVGSSSTYTYELINYKDKPAKYSVIFYYLNDDKEIGIIKEIEEDDAKEIASIKSSKIKIGSKTYEYNSDNYVVYSVTSSNIKTLAFKNIDEDDDLVYVYEYLGKTYLIVFDGAVDTDKSTTSIYNDLQSYIKKVASYENKETSFSQSTFADFLEALENARAVKSSAKYNKIEEALNDLKSAYSSLKTVSSSSSEGKIVSKKADLRALVNGKAKTAVNNKTKYTSETYSKFDSKLTYAKKILNETDATLSEVTDAYDDLNEAINKLVLITNTQEYKDALALLNAQIERGNKLQSKENYTETSYNNYKKAYDAAVLVKNNASSKTVADIKLATQNLSNAIDNIQLALDKVKDDLNDLIVSCIDIINAEDDYVPSTFASFQTAYDNARKAAKGTDLNAMKQAMTNLNKAKSNLKRADDELNAVVKAVEKMKTAPNVAEALSMDAKKASEKMTKIDNIKKAAKRDLEEMVQQANDKAIEIGPSGSGKLYTAIGSASDLLDSANPTLEAIVNAYDTLNTLVNKS